MVVCLLLVSAVMVQEVAHDDATVAFFLGHSLAEKQCEEEVELEVQLVTKEQRVVMLVEELLAGVQRLGPTSRGSRWVSLAGSWPSGRFVKWKGREEEEEALV